jgi:2,4-dienoyl-CoA reductase-like NADH-dependent reductase (Old Yellow Enzyme family)
MNATDHLPGGITLKEARQIVILLQKAGLQAAEISGGMDEAGSGSVWPGERSEEEEGYFVPLATSLKTSLKIPVSGLGGIRSFRVAEKFVDSGQVDLISMSRPFINHPGLLLEFQSGRLLKSFCISCNRCFNPRGIRCVRRLKNLDKKRDNHNSARPDRLT